MHAWFLDLRHAVRTLGRSRGHTALIVVLLGLGIGGTTALFTVLDALVLRPLPFPDSGRLVLISEANPAKGLDGERVVPGRYRDFKATARSFEELGATWAFLPMNLSGVGEAERVRVALASAAYFRVLGVTPALGRTFDAEDERRRAPVAIVSDGLWRRLFGARPNALGDALTLDGTTHTVVGVVRAGTSFPSDIDVWLPLGFDVWNRVSHSLTVIARLRRGVSVEMARVELRALAAGLASQHPDTDAGWSPVVVPLHDHIVGDARTTLMLLMGAVVIVLLIACVNVANLLLARASGRQVEIAVRSALGASRWRLVRQFLGESLLLALAGGLTALAIAQAGLTTLLALAPATLARGAHIRLDTTALAFTLAVSSASAVLFGLLPALHVSRFAAARHLGSRGETPTRGSARARAVLVVSEIALAMVLLTSASLTIGSLLRLSRVDLGLASSDVVTARLTLPFSRYSGRARVAFAERLRERLQALPGVGDVALVSNLPLGGRKEPFRFRVEQRVGKGDMRLLDSDHLSVTPGYFSTLGIPLLAGRAFDERDGPTGNEVAVVNEALAARYWGHAGPAAGHTLGARVSVDGPDGPWRTIVGVVGNVRPAGPDREIRPELYLPYAQDPWPAFSMVLRTTAELPATARAIRAAVAELDPDVPLYEVATLDDLIARTTAARRFHAALLSVFAGTALVLATAGLYGVVAWTVAQRRRETGIRMALGATPRRMITSLVVPVGIWLAVGECAGLVGSVAIARLMSAMLFETAPTDLLGLGLSAAFLALVALAAAVVPATRAAKTDPSEILR
jgi:predicted permease